VTWPYFAAYKFMAQFFLPCHLSVKIWVLLGQEQTSGAKPSCFCILDSQGCRGEFRVTVTKEFERFPVDHSSAKSMMHSFM